ncbi:MAG: glycosyltransferase family 4 protein [Candidatus Obscuribacterales bacterium]|nr:glycosyltransferase family 4 protein [Candidatus Obscuribacterales bacterium]
MTVHKFFPEHRAGTEVLTLKIAQEVIRRGHQVLVVTANPPDTDARYREGEEIRRYTYEGVDVVSLEEPLRLKGYRFPHEYQHPAMRQQFASLIEEFSPDLVHVLHAQNLSASVIEEAKARRLPVILSTTDFWFICPIVQLKRPDGSVCEGPGEGAKNCLTCYTPKLLPPKQEFKEAISKRFPGISKMAGSLGQNLLYEGYLYAKSMQAVKATAERPEILAEIANSVDAITVPTLLMKRLFIKNGIREDLIHHIPFGIDTGKLVDWCEKSPSSRVRIGYIGTLFEHKGVDILIKAFQRLNQPNRAVLKIYGSPEQFPEYAETLHELAFSDINTKDAVSFLGTFPNEDFGKVLSELDVLVVPSRWYENTPLVMQSALATKTPLIATDLGGMAELIEPGINGLLFQLNDHDDLAAQLARIVDERELLPSMRSNIGPQRTMKEMVDDLEVFYNNSLNLVTST